MTDNTTVKEDDGEQSNIEQRQETESKSEGSNEKELGILEVRNQVTEVAETLLGQPFDGITSVEATDDGEWQAVFEVVERSAVPDTQDIIGRYELILSKDGDVQEYSLQQRFKRSEMQGKSL